ncbi:MAG: DNA-processing protein DprA [Patescibacteria group bacterium]|nr:DNA-processing protein DprA [Patescibacteria group bacterium]
MSLPEKAYWVAFGQISRLTPVRFKKIISYFPSLETAWFASRDEFHRAGLDQEAVDDFFIKRSTLNPAELWQRVVDEDIAVATINDPNYPAILKEIYDPPPFLYYRGNLENPDEFRLAVVGTRKTSPYGRQVAEELVRDLAVQKLCIVSGLALGIDSLAHEAALSTGGRTIAVLGSGLDRASIYPHTNRRLAERIVDSGGAVVSELPLGSLALKHHFPARNRIISGLALGTLVVEAGEESGSLITARAALDQGREVFAVPGPIHSPTAAGPNALIKMGAHPVTEWRDILEALNLNQVKNYIENQKILPASSEEEKILALLTREPTHIDAIIKQCGIPAAAVAGALSLMEMKGKVRNLGGMNYVLGR